MRHRILPAAAVCLILATRWTAAQPVSQQDLDAVNWVNQHYDSCLARRFPAHEEMFESPLDHQTTVTLRAADDCTFERQITIFEEPGGAVKADVTAVDGASLDDQMIALHTAQPNLNPADLCARVKIRSFQPAGEEARRVTEAFRKLKEMRAPIIPGVITRIHGIRYELWLTTGEVTSHFAFSGATEGVHEPEEPLAAWAYGLLKSLGLVCRPQVSPN